MPLNTIQTSGRKPKPTGHTIVRAAGVAALIALGSPAAPILAQSSGDNDERRSMPALHLEAGEGIRLDGNIDEPLWSRAAPAGAFFQRDPLEGVAPTESTTVYVAYDSDNLYIAAILFDSDPSGIRAQQKQRDALRETDDRFMWVIDTFLDGRTGYFFGTNPNALMSDGLLGAGGMMGINMSWDGIWDVRTARRPDGWSLEIRIPFRTLNFNPSSDAWGINFQRTIRRKNEETVWTGFRRNQSLTRPIHAGLLTGLQGMSQGMGLEAKPYAAAGWQYQPGSDPTADATDFPADVGFDMSYSVTPSMRASLTVNTDFAEVDVDRRRVNLTRFSQRFPERRDFFLEGSSAFTFATMNGVEPYFSRNIGLYEGNPVPITYGARLGGQAGRFETGFLQVRTGFDRLTSSDGSFTDIQGEDFTVARVKRSLFSQSSVGVLYTRRATSQDETGFAPEDRHTVGADLDLYTSKFLGDKNLQFQAFFVWNSDPVPGSSTFWERTARGVRLNFPNSVWRFSTSYRELDVGYDPAVGYTQRNGFRRFQPTMSFAPRPRGFLGLRQLEFRVAYEHLMDMDWDPETRKTDFKVLGLRFNSGDRVDFDITHLYERLEEEDAFWIRGVPIPAGEYNMVSWRVSTRTASQRVLSGSFTLSGGEFWSGTRTGYDLNLSVRPMPGISFSSRFNRNNISLPDGDFTTNLGRLSAGWQLSPWAAFNGNVQYDDGSELVGLYGRFRWIIRPGNDLYFVYTHNWYNQGDRFRDFEFSTVSRGATTKLSYTHRF
jgi:hypothetical protein